MTTQIQDKTHRCNRCALDIYPQPIRDQFNRDYIIAIGADDWAEYTALGGILKKRAFDRLRALPLTVYRADDNCPRCQAIVGRVHNESSDIIAGRALKHSGGWCEVDGIGSGWVKKVIKGVN